MRRALPRRSFSRPELKSVGAGMGRTLAGWTTGAGNQPWAPGARFDYGRAVGNAANNSVVSICLAWIRKQVPQGRLCVGTFDAAKRTYREIPNHWLPKLVNRPNATWSRRATLGGVSDSLTVDGNGYLFKGRDGGGFGQVRELTWVPNWQVEIERHTSADAPGPVKRYWYWRNDGRREPWEPRDVVHVRAGIDPEDPAKGLADLKKQVRNLAGTNAGETYTVGVLRRGHSGVVLVPKEPLVPGQGNDLSPDEEILQAETRKIASTLSGDGAGGFYGSVLPLDVLDIGLGPEELLLDRILDRPEAMIVAQLGLNSLVLQLPSSHDTRTYSNLAEARRDAWENAVIPLQDLVAEELERQLLYTVDDNGEPVAEQGDPEGLCVWWDRTGVAALREDATDRAARAVSLFTGGLLPQNRALAEGDFDPVEDGDERYYGDPGPSGLELAESGIGQQGQNQNQGDQGDQNGETGDEQA